MIIDKMYGGSDELIGYLTEDKVYILNKYFKKARTALIDKYKHFVLLSEAELAITKPDEKAIIV